jgi:hypothetical protein
MKGLRTSLSATMVTVGLLTVGTGVYFMALRPALLPEDLRFSALDRAEIPMALVPWLRIVFRTWGAFIVGLGLCLLGQGASYIGSRSGVARLGTILGLLFAFSSFLVSNIQIRSEFLWFIALLFFGAVAIATLLVLSWRRTNVD